MSDPSGPGSPPAQSQPAPYAPPPPPSAPGYAAPPATGYPGSMPPPITPSAMAMGGAAPATDWTSLTEAEKARVSPLRSEAVRQAINDRLDTMRAFGVDFSDFADEGIAQR